MKYLRWYLAAAARGLLDFSCFVAAALIVRELKGLYWNLVTSRKYKRR